MSKEISVNESKSEMVQKLEEIKTGLQAFEEEKNAAMALVEGCGDLKIKDIEDKEAIKIVSEKRKELKGFRVRIEKQGKSMRDPLTTITKEIKAKENELIAIVLPYELELEKQEEWVKSERERIKKAEEDAEKVRMQNRIDRLAAYGFTIDYDQLVSMNDEHFDFKVAEAKAAWEEEQEEERIKKEEEEKKQQRIDQQLKELEALKKMQRTFRLGILKEMGLGFETTEHAELWGKIGVENLTERLDGDTEEWDQYVESLKQSVSEFKDQEQKRLSKIKKDAEDIELFRSRQAQLKEIGWNGQFAFKRWIEEENIDSIVISWEQYISLSDEEFNAIRDKHNAEADVIIEQKRLAEEKRLKEEQDNKEKELERVRKEAADKALADANAKKVLEEQQEQERLAQASDKEKFQKIIEYLQSLPLPEMKSAKSKRLLAEIAELKTKLITHINSKI